MADLKFQQLTAATPAAGDIVPFVKDPSGVPLDRKFSFSDLLGGAANQVAYFSGVTAITGSANNLFNGTTFAIGGASLDSTRLVNASYTFTPAAGTPIGVFYEIISDPSAGGTSLVASAFRASSTASDASDFVQIAGGQFIGRHMGSGQVTSNLFGGIFDAVQNGSGTVVSAIASTQRLFLTSTGDITTGIHQLFASPVDTGAGVIENLIGLYSNPMTIGTVSNYFIKYDNTTDGFYVLGDGKTGIGVATPTYKLDIAGDLRMTATTNQQFLYTNNSPVEGTRAFRIELSSAIGTINYSAMIVAPTSGVAKTAGTTIGYEASLVVNGADVAGDYVAFSAGNIAATAAGTAALSVGTGWDFAIIAESGIGKFKDGVSTKVSNANVTNPPTDAELDSAFGDPSTLPTGFVGVLDDNGAGTNVWWVYTTGVAGEWFYVAGTKAV